MPAPLAEADSWLGFYERLWNERFDAMQAALEARASETREDER